MERSKCYIVSLVPSTNTNRGSVVVLCRLYQLGDRGSIPGRTSTQGLKVNE